MGIEIVEIHPDIRVSQQITVFCTSIVIQFNGGKVSEIHGAENQWRCESKLLVSISLFSKQCTKQKL